MKIKVPKSKILVSLESSIHKECTCETKKPYTSIGLKGTAKIKGFRNVCQRSWSRSQCRRPGCL